MRGLVGHFGIPFSTDTFSSHSKYPRIFENHLCALSSIQNAVLDVLGSLGCRADFCVNDSINQCESVRT